ncbi:hypothetical protein [Chitinivorax sp. B]|uniref:hypothetical protein n=1 Tax=Chitinivorax sp. B TaxID=2502235 RepID=UPI0010F817F9|nr:hypothetical protein [Chitinivorax sp. B]
MLTPLQPDPMTQLQNRWYNTVVDSLHLSRNAFQLNVPVVPVATEDAAIWAYLNQIPPVSLTANQSQSDGNTFFDQYEAIALQMQFPQSAFEQDIGEVNYQAWMAYLATINPPPQLSALPALFRNWAMVKAPAVMAVGVADLSNMVLINTAQIALLPYIEQPAKPVDYMLGYQAMMSQVYNAPSATVLFDSMAASSDVSNTWAKGVDFGVPGLWAGSSPHSRISRGFAASHVRAQLNLHAVSVWTSPPGAWYSSMMLHLAYSSQSSPPWPADAFPNWQDEFGADGALPDAVGSLLIVNGLTLTVTTSHRFPAVDQLLINDNVQRGTWPLFSPNQSGVVSNQAEFDNDGLLTLTTTVATGHPVVLGANVLAINSYLGHGG